MHRDHQTHPIRNRRVGEGKTRLGFARAIAMISSVSLTLSACAGGTLPDDPFDGEGKALSMVPINHTDRYAIRIAVDKYWAANVPPHGGGGSAVCCYPGVKDWSRPVTVDWTWDAEEDPKTKVLTKPVEPHTAIAHFPSGGPHSDPDEYKDDAYLCVILRDLDTVELAFSPSAFACADK